MGAWEGGVLESGGVEGAWRRGKGGWATPTDASTGVQSCFFLRDASEIPKSNQRPKPSRNRLAEP